MRNRAEVFSHLLQRGFSKKYTCWHMNDEKRAQSNVESLPRVHNKPARQYSMHDMLNDVFDNNEFQDFSPSNLLNNDNPKGDEGKSQEEREEIKKLLEDENQELYDGCTKYNKLSFIVRFYHIKILCGVTDKSFSMILDLLKDVFPQAKLSSSFYESKKMIKIFCLNYNKIDGCPNHCMLYWGSSGDENRNKCKICNTSRYISDENDVGANVIIDDQHRKKRKPTKVLRYFPFIPRLKRLYMGSKTAELLKWHATKANPDGLLRHPRDGKAWKYFDSFYPDFASETRNVRLALAQMVSIHLEI
ncbi:uncharacterized protein LOC129890774 [Solanum dulcamara]|uniref:uncharacterized protein LOC129890774 n=1 Tax=Solanum dulcamara TaxID=45834 RepID=UPI00248662A6|nr:uncharacterized protein LOC129890774 [Solanum dulcamara]